MAYIEQHGFDPRKLVSSVSYVCSNCGSHLRGEDVIVCPNCCEIFTGTSWIPPRDIREAMQKSYPVKASPGKTSNKFKCPNCSTEVNPTNNYCANCGQHLVFASVAK